MKKIIKKFIMLLIVLSLSLVFANNCVYAEINPSTYTPQGSIDRTTVTNYGNKLSGVFILIGIIVAVVALMILGLKFILASTTEKAEYKKYLLPIVIGIFIIASITGIVTLLANIGGSINKEYEVSERKDTGQDYEKELEETWELKKTPY